MRFMYTASVWLYRSNTDSYDATATKGNGYTYTVSGCTDPAADNYDINTYCNEWFLLLMLNQF